MIMIDQNEPEEFDYWLQQSYEIKRGAYNQTSGNPLCYPDFTIVSNKVIGVNRKQASEWLGGITKWEEQLQRELSGPVDMLVQIIEGSVTVDPTYGVWGWNQQFIQVDPYKTREGGVAEFEGFPSQWDYKALMGKLIRNGDAGIPTFFTSNIFGSSIFIAELHSIADREDWTPNILSKLIDVKPKLSERDPKRKDMLLFLMRIPGVGEDAATAILDWFDGSFDDFYIYLRAGLSIATIKSKSGRSLGPAMDKRLKEFFGI